MKLVVEIPEEQYITLNAKSQEEVVAVLDYTLLVNAIKNGIPLTKGYGRLIDADRTISEICGNSCGCHLEECGYDKPCYSVARINSAQTIIEADKE